MSAKAEIITTMKQLVQLNTSLLEIARTKTDLVTKGDIESFKDLQNNEQKHILAIQKINANREKAVASLLPNLENPTISDCIPHLDEEDRPLLIKLKNDLLEKLTDLQDQNDLNQQLLAQSLQYINASMQMLLPRQEEMNYGPPTTKRQQTETKRIFQSEV